MNFLLKDDRKKYVERIKHLKQTGSITIKSGSGRPKTAQTSMTTNTTLLTN